MADLKILEKIKKLLAMSQSENPNEAAIFLAKAQALMAEHGIEDAALRLSDVSHADVPSQFSISNAKDYETVLVNQIAQLFGCQTVFMSFRCGTKPAIWRLIGRKDKVALAEHTVVVMTRKLRAVRKRHGDSLSRYLSPAAKTSELNGFCKGFVMGVIKPLTQFALGAEEAALLDEYKAQTLGKVDEGKAQQTRATRAGLAEGYQAGQQETLQRPMGTHAGQVLIG